MSTSLANPGVGLAVLCTVMVVCAAAVYRFTHLGSPLVVSGAAILDEAKPWASARLGELTQK